jgi:predicted dehydrogenase
VYHLLRCIADDVAVEPHGATLEDGYRTAEVCDGIIHAIDAGQRVDVTYCALSGPSATISP